MGAAAPAIALVGTVAGIAGQASQTAANNKAARLQQEANNRATQIRIMGLDLQQAQLEQQIAQDKVNITSQAELANLSVQVAEIQRNIQAAQQLASIDVGTAQKVLESTAKQYQVARDSFLQKQQLQSNKASMYEEASNQYEQLRGNQDALVKAIQDGDINLASSLARETGYAYTDTSRTGAAFQQQQYEVMKRMLEATTADERIQEDLLLNSEYADFLNRAIEASLAVNSSQLSAEAAGNERNANSARDITQVADKGAERVSLLSQALIPQARDIQLRQTDMDLAYAREATANSKLEAQFAGYSNNLNIERSKQSTNWLANIAAVGQAAVPLVSQLSFFNRQAAPSLPVWQYQSSSNLASSLTPGTHIGY